jgi:ABC-type lipoprotein export system ATPase subunit
MSDGSGGPRAAQPAESQPPARQSLAQLERAAAAAPVKGGGFGAGSVIACDRLVRVYSVEGIEIQALQGLDLFVAPGELTALVGASGSGKSTLLNILSGLDRPTAGQVLVDGHDLLTMKTKERLEYRRRTVGFIWQQTARNLLPYLTATENIELPMRFAGTGRHARRARAAELLGLLEVADCADRYPAQMSGGEQQCVAIGVALANQPQVVLADEPTGELDSVTADHVFSALRTVNAESGVTILVVTHDAAVSGQVRRTIAIRDGRTSTEVMRPAGDGRAAGEGAEEFAVLDRSGRLQLPQEFTDALEMRQRVRLALQADHIGVWPASPGTAAQDEEAS